MPPIDCSGVGLRMICWTSALNSCRVGGISEANGSHLGTALYSRIQNERCFQFSKNCHNSSAHGQSPAPTQLTVARVLGHIVERSVTNGPPSDTPMKMSLPFQPGG